MISAHLGRDRPLEEGFRHCPLTIGTYGLTIPPGTMFTGERINPDDLIWRAHSLRTTKAYELGGWLGQGRRVLDVGCGAGYGSSYVNRTASAVIGVDRSPQAMTMVKEYRHLPHLWFLHAEAVCLPVRTSSVDLVLAVQMLEHLKDYGMFLDEVKRVLAPPGIFLCSTPNKLTSYDVDPYHFHSFDPAELKRALSRYFSFCKLIGIFGGMRYMRLKDNEHNTAGKILRYDWPGFHKYLPRRVRAIPFNIIFHYVLRKTMKKNTHLYESLSLGDLSLEDHRLENCLDIIAVCGS